MQIGGASNRRGGMKAIHAYVAFVCVSATLLLLTQDWSILSDLARRDWQGLLVLFALGLLSESLTVRFAGARGGGTHTITFIPLLASVLLFGPAVGVLFFAVTGALAEFLIRRKEFIRAAFNVGQYIVAASVAGLVYSINGVSLAGPHAEITPPLIGMAASFLGFGVAFLAINHAAVSLAIAISQRTSFAQVWRNLVGKSGAGILYDLSISPLAILVVALYLSLGVSGLFVALLPLFFIRHSYHTNFRLSQANRALLQALVKAIETRDPYTSGHSQRVASLARSIAEGLLLPTKTVEDIETAALLHDVGKIDAVYSFILRKPEQLTPQERGIIESHVTKGADLLLSLGFFPDRVIHAVQHHHERVDGKGYPCGLQGAEISLGGKIIKLCDAIDAMLSDRPYRKALTIPDVEEQLRMFSGTQFDATLVGHVIAADILRRHAAAIVRQDDPPSRAPAARQVVDSLVVQSHSQ